MELDLHTRPNRPAGPSGRAAEPAGGSPLPPVHLTGRHCEISDAFRAHVQSKLAPAARLDHKLFRLDVEVCKEHNPRQSKHCERVEITGRGRGPLVRAEASAQDIYAALDLAAAKFEERLRRAADRRHSRGSRIAHAHDLDSAPLPDTLLPAVPTAGSNGHRPSADSAAGDAVAAQIRGAAAAQPPAHPAAVHGAAAHGAGVDGAGVDGAGVDGAGADGSGVDGAAGDAPGSLREKVHATVPMTVDEALHEMELVGHDFYLFADATDGRPSVVYRRRGYHYGVLRLTVAGDAKMTP